MTTRMTLKALLPVAILLAAPAFAQDDPAGAYAQAKADTASLERFIVQQEEQVRSQEAEIGSLERQLVEIDTTNRQVQPLLEQMVNTLVRFVELDVPFLLEERTSRVRDLQALMSRSDVSVAEKYRLILEAYQAELDYGRTLEAYEGRLGTGADARTVEFARLGRVSLMYRTLDGSETGYWDAQQKQWVVDDSYADKVEEAIRVARGDGPPELLIVPVPVPQEVRS